MCWFYMGKGIAQIALDPPSIKRANHPSKPLHPLTNLGKKVLQTILASPYAPTQMWERSAPNHPRRPLHPPLPDNAHMETPNFKKGLPLQVRLF